MSATEPPPIECPLASLEMTLPFHPRDWSEHHRDAWIYGVIVGWDTALEDVAHKHGWTPETVARLQRLRERFLSLKAQT